MREKTVKEIRGLFFCLSKKSKLFYKQTFVESFLISPMVEVIAPTLAKID